MVIGRVNSQQKADSAVQHFNFHLKTRILPLINNGVKKKYFTMISSCFSKISFMPGLNVPPVKLVIS